MISHVLKDGSEQPIVYTSRTLSSAERNYAQVEMEALSLVFGVRKFHQYLYGWKFVMVTDHKSLLALLELKKGIPPLAAARLQQWAILLSAYTYELEFRSTEKHANADCLSRLPLETTVAQETPQEVMVFNICQIEALPITNQQLERATRNDPLLSKVLRYTQHGWPARVEDKFKPYWGRRHKLSVEQNGLLWEICVIVPNKLQPRVIQEIHQNHSSIVRMNAIARSYAWWRGIDANIEHCVKSCAACQVVRSSPNVAPLHPWLWPTKPWQRIHVDFAGPFRNRMFLLVIDAHSKWLEKIEKSTTMALRTIEELRRLFAAYGLPEQVVSDNGPQFSAEEFATSMKMNGIKYIRRAPYHPASNGVAERMVQTFKRAMKAWENSKLSLS